MAPERTRMLNLLVVRCYLMNAHMTLQLALIVEEFESDRRSRLFERYFERAWQLEQIAHHVASGRIRIRDVEPSSWAFLETALK